MSPSSTTLNTMAEEIRSAEIKRDRLGPDTIAFLQTVGALRALSERLDSQAMDADVGVAGYMLAQTVREAAQRLAIYVSLEFPGQAHAL